MTDYIVPLGEFLDLKKLEALLKTMKAVNYKKDPAVTLTDTDRMVKMIEKYEERGIFRKTDGYAKIENFVKDMAREPKFFEFLKEARKKFGIPDKGFEYIVGHYQDEEVKRIWKSKEFMEYVKNFPRDFTCLDFMFFMAGVLLFEVPTGAFADVFGRKKSIIWGFFVLARFLSNSLETIN